MPTAPANRPLSPLTRIRNDLRDQDFDARLIGVDDDNLYERLFVVFAPDPQGRDQILQIVYLNDMLALSGQQDDPEDMMLLQFMIELPFKVPEPAYAEVSRLLLSLTQLLPVGAFGLLEASGDVYYNYVHPTAERSLESVVSANIVGLVDFYIPDFATLIEAVARGERSRESVLEQLVKEQLMPESVPSPTQPGYDPVHNIPPDKA